MNTTHGLTDPPTQPIARWRRWRSGLLTAVCALALLTPAAWAQTTVIAYAVPAGTEGNQDFSGALGMDFDVDNPILITRLGVFDDASDGLNLWITARLYDRADPANPVELVTIDFSPEDPGDLIGGSRFKALPEPLRLEIGFQGTIVAEGYGPGEQLRNAGVGVPPAGVSWTMNDGNGSLKFVGAGRWGDMPGIYPANPDDGPAARYAAGTFEYETTPPQIPGKPIVTISPSDQHIQLSWPAVTLPLPAASYRVLRGDNPAGPFVQIGDTTELQYSDGGLVNGTIYCYVIQGVSATGKVGQDSDVKCAAPYVLAENHVVAYFTPAGTSGTQAFGGSLGMDFDVENPVIVKRLGVFDDNSDGLKLSLSARIFNRETQELMVEEYFWPEDPGDLIDGMRFKTLLTPIRLEAGFKGVIQADGYGEGERLRNSGGDTNLINWTLNSGHGSLKFVGTSRYALSAGTFPDVIDGGPAARYAAGTFEFEVLPPERPGTPALRVQLPVEDAAATLFWDVITEPLPAAKYAVYRALSVDGPFALVAEVTATAYHDTGLVNDTPLFYKLVAVGSGGEVSFDSNTITVTPNPTRAGIAYVNPEFQEGNQGNFGGSLGMDFTVDRPIQITKLGVFDEYSDGLYLTLHAAIWDRKNTNELANLEFTPEDPGDLVGGSRFKALSTPLVLPPGFQGTIVAYGYGALERLFNTGNRPEDVALLQTFDGASLTFVGLGRWSATAGAFPDTADGGPANRYAAGTFYFEPITLEPPTLSIAFADGKITITWTNGGKLHAASDVNGPWTEVTGAVSGFETTPTTAQAFYRVQQ